MKPMAIYHIALWMFLGYKVTYGALLQEHEKIVVKRQADDLIHSIASVALEFGVETGLAAWEQISKGSGAFGKVETDVGILGQQFHQKKEIGAGIGGGRTDERKRRSTSSLKEILRRKRSPQPEPESSPGGGGCRGKNGTSTGTQSGSNSTVITREANPNAETLARRKRTPRNILSIEGNSKSREKRSPQSPPDGFPSGPPPDGSPPNGPPPNGPPPNGPPPNGPPPNGQPPNGPPPNGPRPSGPPPNGTQPNENGQDLRENNSARNKRSPKPCDGNGQPNGSPLPANTNIPSQQFPQQQQRLPNGDVVIGNLQRDQRVKRAIEDPDKVVPVGNGGGAEKNMFERISEFVMETFKRVARWASENDREKAIDKSTSAVEKPTL